MATPKVTVQVRSELVKGDDIACARGHKYRINRVSKGTKFEEPVYRLETMAGVVLKKRVWTAEELAANGYAPVAA